MQRKRATHIVQSASKFARGLAQGAMCVVKRRSRRLANSHSARQFRHGRGRQFINTRRWRHAHPPQPCGRWDASRATVSSHWAIAACFRFPCLLFVCPQLCHLRLHRPSILCRARAVIIPPAFSRAPIFTALRAPHQPAITLHRFGFQPIGRAHTRQARRPTL
jgi:hypothetical protein